MINGLNCFGLSLLLLLYSHEVVSQQCQSFDPTTALASAGVCPPYLAEQIWVPLAFPGIQGIIDNSFNESYLWQVRAVESISPQSCFDSLLSLLCNTAFPPCQNVFVPELDKTVPIAFPECRSTCEYVNNQCSDFFDYFSQPYLNCSQPNALTGGDQWPIDYLFTTVNGVVVNSSCFTADHLPKSNVTRKKLPCPFPLVAVQNPTETGPLCGIPCPDPTWTPQQWHALAQTQVAFAALSVALMIFLSLHYIVDPKCRKSTKRFQLYSFLCQLMFAASFLVGGTDPAHDVWCENDTTFASFDKPACGVQAFFFVVFGLASSNWWAISSAIMYIQLETRMYRISLIQELIYHLIAFGIPILLIIVAISQGTVEFYWITPFCFIQTIIPDTERLNFHFVLFYFPMCISILVSVGFIIATMVKLIRHARQMNTTFNKQQATGGVSLYKVNIRLFTWCASLFLFFFTIVIYRALLEESWETLQDDAKVWGVCKIKYELGLGADTLCPESVYPRPINFPGTYVHYIITTTVGTFSFLSFGTTATIYYFWLFLAQLVYKRKWHDLRELLTNEKAYAVMRTKEAMRRSAAMKVEMEMIGGKGESTSGTAPSDTSPDESAVSSVSRATSVNNVLVSGGDDIQD